MGCAIGVLVGLTLSFGNLNAQDSPFYITPFLQNVSPNAITVMWETLEPEKGSVNYGEAGSFDQSATEDVAVKIHEIRLEGLKTGTTYDYQVPAPDGTTFTASFTTAPEPGSENWRLVVYGDNRSNPATHSGNVEQIMKLKPGIILNSGDLVARGKEYDQWKAQYFDPMRGLAEYVPIFPCLGNHEQNADHYYNYASVPEENGRSTTPLIMPTHTSFHSTATSETLRSPEVKLRPSG